MSLLSLLGTILISSLSSREANNLNLPENLKNLSTDEYYKVFLNNLILQGRSDICSLLEKYDIAVYDDKFKHFEYKSKLPYIANPEGAIDLQELVYKAEKKELDYNRHTKNDQHLFYYYFNYLLPSYIPNWEQKQMLKEIVYYEKLVNEEIDKMYDDEY